MPMAVSSPGALRKLMPQGRQSFDGMVNLGNLLPGCQLAHISSLGFQSSQKRKSQSTGANKVAATTTSAAVFVIAQPTEKNQRQAAILRVAKDGATSTTTGLTAGGVWLANAPDGRILLLGEQLGIPGCPVCGAAWWDGAALVEAFPSCGSDGAVNCIKETRDGSLIICGSFSRCAGVPARCVVHVAPNGCKGIATDFDSGVSYAAPDDQGDHVSAEATTLAEAPDGSVLVAGAFDHAGSVATHGVARWTGGAWTALGDLGNGTRCLAAPDANRVVAGGSFRSTNGTHHLLCWDGRGWSPLGADPDDDVCDIKVDADGSLLIVGFFPPISVTSRSPISHDGAARAGIPWDPVSTILPWRSPAIPAGGG